MEGKGQIYICIKECPSRPPPLRRSLQPSSCPLPSLRSMETASQFTEGGKGTARRGEVGDVLDFRAGVAGTFSSSSTSSSSSSESATLLWRANRPANRSTKPSNRQSKHRPQKDQRKKERKKKRRTGSFGGGSPLSALLRRRPPTRGSLGGLCDLGVKLESFLARLLVVLENLSDQPTNPTPVQSRSQPSDKKTTRRREKEGNERSQTR